MIRQSIDAKVGGRDGRRVGGCVDEILGAHAEEIYGPGTGGHAADQDGDICNDSDCGVAC